MSDPSVVDEAKKLIRGGQTPRAIEMLQQEMQTNPSHGKAQELLGMAWFSSQQYESACDAFKQLTRIDPRYAPGWTNLGAVQNVLKDFRSATKSLRKAIQFDKKNAAAYYNLGIAQKGMKANSMAVSAYREAIKLAPDMPEPYANLANLYIDMKNLRQAVKTAEDGASRFPRFKKIHVILQKAKNQKEGNRQAESPLGRLVDEKELAKKTVRVSGRQLDDEVRNNEREFLRGKAREIREAARPMVKVLDNGLPGQIHTLAMVASHKADHGVGGDALDDMVVAVKQLDELRQISRGVVSEIRESLQRTDPGL